MVMNSKDTGPVDTGLDAFFGAARSAAPVTPPDLMARVLADGIAEQARLAAQDIATQRAASLGFAGWLADLRHWGRMTGLATAALAGIYLGFNPPPRLAALADSAFGTSFETSGSLIDQVDLLPGYDQILTEG